MNRLRDRKIEILLQFTSSTTRGAAPPAMHLLLIRLWEIGVKVQCFLVSGR